MLDRILGDLKVVAWPEHRVIYVRVPKSGNTSISKAIPDGEKRRVSSRRLARTRPGWLVFSFVRNPWSRLVSTYCQKVDLETANPAKMIDGVYKGFRELGMPVRPDMSFEEFAELVCGLPDDKTDKHLRSQCSFLVRDGRVVPEFVGRVETMNEDWDRMAKQAGVSFNLPHLNRTRHDRTASYYTSAHLCNLVGDRYREDVERFGYELPEE